MTKSIRILQLIIIMLAAASCTHNDGDIGPLFGFWRLEALAVDGNDVKLYDDETLLYTFAFQDEVVLINTTLPHSDYDRCFGSWRRDGSTLTLDFDHTDSDDVTKYNPPAALMFDPSGVTTFDIIRLDSSHMTLAYTDAEGRRLTYYLKKTR